MGYGLGVDLGTTYAAAASIDGGEPAMLGLGNRALQIPSVLYLQPDGTVLVGEAAERRGAADPTRVVREFKRRIGDHVPILVAGTPYSPQALTARLLSWVLAQATERLGEPPERVTLTHPANWGSFKLDLLRQAADLADLAARGFCPEPVAAAMQYASRTRVGDGDRIAVYDLGGGTFDVSVVAKTGDGFCVLGHPEGIEHLGGIDFDEAVFRRVLDDVEMNLAGIDRNDPDLLAGMARLRRDCVEAKEALSSDVDTVIPVSLPGRNTSVRLTRGEFEELIRPALEETLGATRRALRSAAVAPDELSALVLVGGSSRIPLIAELLSSTFRTPVALDTHPKHDVAMGAARAGAIAGGTRTAHAAPGRPAATPRFHREWRLRRPLAARKILAAALVSVATAGGAVALAGDSYRGATTRELPQSAPLPDDQLIAAREVDQNVDLYLVDTREGALIGRLTTDPATDRAPVISPDRRTIIYVRQTGDAYSLRVMAANGDGDRPLFPLAPDVCPNMNRPAWSPLTPDLIAVPCVDAQQRHSLRLIRLDGQIVRTLDVGHHVIADPAFHPDGSRVAYWASDTLEPDGGSLYAIAVDGGQPPVQLTDVPAGTDTQPAWSPDGTEIAFRRRLDNDTRQGNFELFIMNADGSDARPLAPHPAQDSGPTWSPDGTMIAFTSKRGLERGRVADTHTWIVNADGSEPRQILPDDGGTVLWSGAWGHR